MDTPLLELIGLALVTLPIWLYGKYRDRMHYFRNPRQGPPRRPPVNFRDD